MKGFQGARFMKWREDNKGGYGKGRGVSSRNFVEVPDDDPMRETVLKLRTERRHHRKSPKFLGQIQAISPCVNIRVEVNALDFYGYGGLMFSHDV